MFTEKTDEELFIMLRDYPEQQKDVFGELYTRYSRKVFLYCRKVLEKNNDVNDAFQETWMQFHSKAIKKETTIHNVGGYLFKIARNVCLSKRKTTAEPIVHYEDIYADSNPSDFEVNEINDLLRRALEVLDFDYREAYVLHELEGLSYEDLSQITGESVAALRNRVWRARKHVREFLAPHLT